MLILAIGIIVFVIFHQRKVIRYQMQMKQLEADLPTGIDVHVVADQPDIVQQSIRLFVSSLGEAIAIVRDAVAFSDDIIFRCDAGDLAGARRAMGEPRNWEYSETTWVAVAELGAFVAAHGEQMILPTRAMIRLLDWA